MKPRIGITLGDYNGIGPEIVLKSVQTSQVRRICNPVLIGSLDAAAWYARRMRMKVLFKEIENIPDRFETGVIYMRAVRPGHAPVIRPGHCSRDAGMFAGESIEVAARLCLDDQLDGMVTAPVSKSALHTAGYCFPGQTEMLAHLSRMKSPLMILAAGALRVCLATIHVPLGSVPRLITRSRLLEVMGLFVRSLQRDFGIPRPSVAVLGLNPHAGEDGHLGKEEQAIIGPAIFAGRRRRWDVQGPFPSDGFFGTHSYTRYDGVIAMYHDQGLIPLKLKGFASGVNITAGLPLVRTSPDHGTAFDIAGKGLADSRSMVEAIRLAVEIIANRRHRRSG